MFLLLSQVFVFAINKFITDTPEIPSSAIALDRALNAEVLRLGQVTLTSLQFFHKKKLAILVIC